MLPRRLALFDVVAGGGLHKTERRGLRPLALWWEAVCAIRLVRDRRKSVRGGSRADVPVGERPEQAVLRIPPPMRRVGASLSDAACTGTQSLR